MLGWWIVVAARTPEEAAAHAGKEGVLANWEASPGGIDWLQQLVRGNKAQQLLFNGYPCRFTARADDVLPLISNGPPTHDGMDIIGDDYVMLGNWSGKVTLYRDAINACPPEQILIIDAWDQS